MMDVDLIESIVRRVLSEASGGTMDASGPSYLILAEQQHIDALHIARNLPAGARIKTMDEYPEPWTPGVARKFQGFILPVLSLDCMAELVMGRGCDKVGRAILQLLLAGQQVEVLEYAYWAYEETAPPALWNMYCAHQQQLEAFGLVERKTTRPAVTIHRGRLIIEQDVTQLARDGVRCIQTDKQTIVTGLARDRARELGVQIQPH